MADSRLNVPGAGLGIATTKDPSDPNGWTRHGYDQLGKSAALLVRETGPHYAFFGIPAINMARSHVLIKWENITWNWMINDDDFSGFVPAGHPLPCRHRLTVSSPTPPWMSDAARIAVRCASCAMAARC